MTIRFFQLLNLMVPWRRLPARIGVFNLQALQWQLRRENLFYPTLDGQLGAIHSEVAPPQSLAFRTSDGRFNDMKQPVMGAAGTRFGRNTATEPEPQESLLKPNPRLVSQRLLARTDFKPAKTLNLLAAAWIQFQVHDWFDHGDNELDQPFEVPIDADDPWPSCPMKIKRTCRDQTRTAEEDQAGIPPTFVNMASHWWDASAIYGSEPETTKSLRSGTDGKLTTQGLLLPFDREKQEVCTGFSNNWWIGLEALHTLFVNEHNAICDRLRADYPHWDDEQLFQTARLVNAALIAKIHILEWTPALLGHKTLQLGMNANWWGILGERLTKLLGRFGDGVVLSGIPGSPQDHQAVPFALTEEFCSVYRMHCLLPDHVECRRLSDGESITFEMDDILREKSHPIFENRLSVSDIFYSIGIAYPGALVLQNFPNFLRSLTVPAHTAPNASGEPELVDLGAIDILRDRERGVPRYNEFRRCLRMKPFDSFEELSDDPDAVRTLREVYNNDIESVDLLTGTLAEKPPEGFGISETAFRIFLLMAPRRLMSDRFFTKDYTPHIYSQTGMDWINNNDMTSVLLRHYPELAPALWRSNNPFQPWNDIHPKAA